MSASEQWSTKVCACPCGAGQVTLHVDSPDNPWSRALITFTLDCAKCASEWNLEHKTLVNRASESQYKAVRNQLDSVETELLNGAAALVDGYINSLQPKNKKAELAELHKVALCGGLDYRAYVRRRKTLSPGQSACGLGNPAWLLQQAKAGGQEAELSALMAKEKDLSAKAHAAYKKIVRKSIK